MRDKGNSYQVMVECKPFNGYFFHCIGCDKIMPFDGNGHCFFCGCDSPVGSLDDDSLDQDEVDREWYASYCSSEVFYPSTISYKYIQAK